MGAAQLGLSFLSGALSTLSPCVLPLLPIVIGSAVAAHRWGALALGAGLIASFTAFGLFVATIGWSIGLDAETLRFAAGVLLTLTGLVLLVAPLRRRFELATSQLSARGDGLLRRITPQGWTGQLLIGVVLGAIWTPCVGPTLGAASALASQGRDLGEAATVMLAFAIGAALPLILVGSLSRQALGRVRGRLAHVAQSGKLVLGALLLLLGVGIVSGYDRTLEAWLTMQAPDWLITLTTRY
ncbi:cytochrome c biogenesis CcdA family protein [Solimonas marina]|nr:cytochrome c biogenesis CcdA family protein [Solimonas marina]